MDALAALAMAWSPFRPSRFLGIVLFLAGVRFLLAAIAEFGGASEWNLSAGALGLLAGAFAVYGGLDFLFEDMRRKTILPMFRRGQARQAIEGNWEEQLERVDHEAGVRRQL
jgi:hypothetical protein